MCVLDAQELLNKGVVYSDEPIGSDQIQPCGIDLRLHKVSRVGGRGWLARASKTRVSPTERIIPSFSGWYHLERGNSYLFEFLESCNIPEGIAAWIYGRSSLVRCGIYAHSMCFDPGYRNVLGCPAFAFNEMSIEVGARVATFVGFRSESKMLYTGQFQDSNNRQINLPEERMI